MSHTVNFPWVLLYMSKYSVFFNLVGVGLGSLAKCTFSAHSPHMYSLHFAAQQPLAASNFEAIPGMKRLNFVSLKNLQLQKVSVRSTISTPVDFLNIFMRSCD